MDKQEIVFGIHPIIELLKAKRRKIYTVYTTKPEPKAWRDIQKLLPKYVNVEYVSKEKLNKISDSVDHQGIVALASPFIIRKKFFEPDPSTSSQPSPKGYGGHAGRSGYQFLVMLDSIQDPRNLGAILRSAYCTGAQGVIVTEKKSTFLTPTAIKASAGLAEHLEIYFAPNAKVAVDELKKAGYAIYISTLENSKSALEVDFKLPCCIVIGNEGEGVSQNILRAGQNIKLPQITADISYNASVAAGILLFLVSTKNKII